MIDFWKLEKYGVGILLENLGNKDGVINIETMLILAGICFFFLAGSTVTWSLHRAIRRSEERLTERLIHQIHHELLRQQETRPPRVAIAASHGSLKHRPELTNYVKDGLEKQRIDEDEPMEKLLASMRRLKGQHVEARR